jgi:hypothetical protein
VRIYTFSKCRTYWIGGRNPTSGRKETGGLNCADNHRKVSELWTFRRTAWRR